MKILLAACLLLASIGASAQSTLQGKWHGTENNLPVVDLTIERNSGNALFYLIKSNHDGSNRHVDGQAGVPMEDVSGLPYSLTFDVHHRDGELVTFRVELTDADHARLFRTSDPNPGPGWPLIRVKPNTRTPPTAMRVPHISLLRCGSRRRQRPPEAVPGVSISNQVWGHPHERW